MIISTERYLHREGAALFRKLSGCAVLFQLATNAAERSSLYGPDGLVPWSEFAAGFGRIHASVFALSGSEVWFEGCYWAMLTAFMLWTLGVGTRWLTPICWLFLHGLHARNPLILDGGDNALEIFLFYAMIMNLDGLDARPAARKNTAPPSRFDPLRHVLHNAGVVLFTLQVCTIYFVAGTAKLGGTAWINGTALYYVSASEQFGNPLVLGAINSCALFSAVGSWAPLLLQLAFPWVVLFGQPVVRRVAVLLAIMFHGGVAFGLGLLTFGLVMIAAECMLLSDSDVFALRAFVRRVYARAQQLVLHQLTPHTGRNNERNKQ